MKPIFIALLFLINSIVSQTTIVVDSAGAGDYTSINTAISNAISGDTIKVLTGTYSEILNMQTTINLIAIDTTAIINASQGTSQISAPCLIQGFKIYGTFTVHSNDAKILNNIFHNNNVSFFASSGLVKNNVFRTTSTFPQKYVRFGGSGDNTKLYILNNTLYRTYAFIKQNVLFKGNTVNSETSNSPKETEVSSGAKVINNVFNKATSYAISIRGNNVIFQGNKIKSAPIGIITLGGVDSVTVVGNTFENISSRSIEFNSSSAITPYDSWLVSNNVFKEASDIVFVRSVNGFSNMAFKNNNIYNSDQLFSSNSTLFNLDSLRSSVENNIIQDNNNSSLFDSFTGNMNYSIHNTLAITGIGNLTDNVQFIDPSTNDFRLDVGSPAINAGNPNIYSYDLDRTRNDMGMYGGSYNWNNYNGTSGPQVFSLKLSTRRVIQGNSPTITAQGVSH